MTSCNIENGSDVSSFRKIGEKLGSNRGGTYENPENKCKYYLKFQRKDRGESEALASQIYLAAGIDAADVQTANYNGDFVTLSPIIESKEDFNNRKLNNKEFQEKIQAGFAIDCLLANWDVFGAALDNIIIDLNGNPVRVDTGGALYFRAMGGDKPSFFDDENVSELKSLRNERSYYGQTVFGRITINSLQLTLEHLNKLTDEIFDTLTNKYISDKSLANKISTTLKRRRDFIREKLTQEEEQKRMQNKRSNDDDDETDVKRYRDRDDDSDGYDYGGGRKKRKSKKRRKTKRRKNHK
jgi:hypothetical protein